MRVNEKQITNDCIEWLRSKNWICRRQHVGTFKPMSGGAPVTMGENGECDWRCMRAAHGKTVEYFELEMKAPGKKPRPDQLEYMAKRTHQGFNVVWADSLNVLKKWYATRYE